MRLHLNTLQQINSFDNGDWLLECSETKNYHWPKLCQPNPSRIFMVAAAECPVPSITFTQTKQYPQSLCEH